MQPDDSQTRRQYLLLAGGTTLLGLAGCTGDQADGETPNDGGGNLSDNHHDDGHHGGDDDHHDDDGHHDDDSDHHDSKGEKSADKSDVAASVDVVPNAFEPAYLTVDVGDTVEWTLQEGSHTVTLYHDDDRSAENRAPSGVEEFDDELGDGSFRWTFETAGVYDYYCDPHEGSGMVGTVIVGQPTSDEPGLTEPTDLPDDAASRIKELNEKTRSEFGLEQSDQQSGDNSGMSGGGGGSGYGY